MVGRIQLMNSGVGLNKKGAKLGSLGSPPDRQQSAENHPAAVARLRQLSAIAAQPGTS